LVEIVDGSLPEKPVYNKPGHSRDEAEPTGGRNEHRCADISCVLLHFPFVNFFYTKVVEAVESGRYGYLTTDQ
jgi:hypothetical protein